MRTLTLDSATLELIERVRVLIEARHLAGVRKEMRGLVVGGRRLHFYQELDRTRRSVLTSLATMPLRVDLVVFFAASAPRTSSPGTRASPNSPLQAGSVPSACGVQSQVSTMTETWIHPLTTCGTTPTLSAPIWWWRRGSATARGRATRRRPHGRRLHPARAGCKDQLIGT